MEETYHERRTRLLGPRPLAEAGDVDSRLVCAICQERFKKPVILRDTRNSFCEECLVNWLEVRETDPKSNVELSSRSSLEDHYSRDLLSEYLLQEGGHCALGKRKFSQSLEELYSGWNLDEATRALLRDKVGVRQVSDFLELSEAMVSELDLPLLQKTRLGKKIQSMQMEAAEEVKEDETKDRILLISEANLNGDVDEVVRIMREYGRESAAISEAGCSALYLLHLESETRAEAVLMKGIETVTTAMSNHEMHRGVQEQACRVLELVCQNGNGDMVAQSRGIERVTAAMRNHERHEEVQEAGCVLLWHMMVDRIVDRSQRDRVAREGGIERVMTAMRNHEGNGRLQKDAMHVLCGCMVESPENQRKVVVARGIERVMAAMENHEGFAEVQACGCLALAAISFKQPENRKKILYAGGMERVTAAMRNHDDASGTKEVASFTKKVLQGRVSLESGLDKLISETAY